MFSAVNAISDQHPEVERMQTLTTVARVMTIAAIGTFIGCASKSPTAPGSPFTTSPSAPGAVSTGATLDGSFVSGSATARTVSVAGTTLSSVVDGSGHFGLQGIPTGNIQLQIGGSTAGASVMISNVAMQEHIHVSLRLNGSTVEVNEDERETPDNQAEVDGLVTAIDPVAHQLTVSTFVVSIPAGTPIRRDDAPIQFSDLHVGDRVEIHGAKSGSTIVATSVNDETESATAPQSGDDAPGHETDEHHGDTSQDGSGHDGSGSDGSDGGGHDGSGHH
jgi:hypothetical protein